MELIDVGMVNSQSSDVEITLVSGSVTAGPEAMSNAFLDLFDGPLLAYCAPEGKR